MPLITIRKLSLVTAAALALALAGSAVLAHSPAEMKKHADFGEPDNPKKPARAVPIVMREEGARMIFVPDRVEVRKGEQIRFVLTNEGMVNHESVLGTQEEIEEHAKEMKQHPGMEHDDAHSRTLGMYGSDQIVWRFTKPGRFLFACLIPGHLEKGMVGTVIVNGAK
jgi:uncharacterized cupredoxin-like copper-binding protein